MATPGRDEDAAFAITLADALVDRAIGDDEHAFWRFIEHRNAEPLLPPGPGWMQGAAGIAAYLFRLARVLEQGRSAPSRLTRMDTWWVVPTTLMAGRAHSWILGVSSGGDPDYAAGMYEGQRSWGEDADVDHQRPNA